MSHKVSCDTDVILDYGVNAAFLAASIRDWILYNRKHHPNLHDGREWMFRSAREWSEKQFPHMQKITVERALKKLVDAGILTTGNWNKKKYDRTTWYAFTDESVWLQSPVILHASPVQHQETPDTSKMMHEETPDTSEMMHPCINNVAPIPTINADKDLKTTPAEAKAKAKGPTQLPEDWFPGAAEADRINKLGITMSDPEFTINAFRDYWHNNKKRKKDWPTTFINWVKRDHKPQQGTSHGKQDVIGNMFNEALNSQQGATENNDPWH